MLNDKELAKLVKAAGGKRGKLILEKYKEGFLVSDTFTLFYVQQDLYPKTCKEIAGAFMGLPDHAHKYGGVIQAGGPKMANIFESEQGREDLQEVQKTSLVSDDTGTKGRYFANAYFVMTVNEGFTAVIDGHTLKARGKNNPLLLFNEAGECEGLVLPIRSELDGVQIESIIWLAGFIPKQSGKQEENVA